MSEFTPEEVEALRLSLACEPRMVESATVLMLIAGYQRLMADVLTLSDKLSQAAVASPEFLAAARALYRAHATAGSLSTEQAVSMIYEVNGALAALTPEQIAVLAGDDAQDGAL
ncbi:hypothetical protein [Nonomuraea guangzhouensis]|uniref:Uncharacterized protein n=1 Tax=Nonomuraea guangzhouensis TaxID=1291555 RepID=A0ABW4GWI4_9ACTN|nr:hypothetical protein [Nonomuraea guangzhouensis]